jgi:hypothetical protein
MKQRQNSPTLISRRQFVYAGLALSGHASFAQLTRTNNFTSVLPAWARGDLEIHQIDTGRGNAMFLLAPDGTTMLIDCGTTRNSSDLVAPPRPNGSLQPGEWVARYAMRRAKAAGRSSLDYMIATHVHPDHVGDLPAGVEPPIDGSFVPTGLSQVDQIMPAETVIDRSFPDYGLLPPQGAFAENYLAWLRSRARAGKRVEKLKVGSQDQIVLRSQFKGPPFSVRGLAANGQVWTGNGEHSRSIFPNLSTVDQLDRPSENPCSIALRISYGNFSYFTGGDLNADTHDGRQTWLDVESPATKICGRVEVALADHHAYFDACGPKFVDNLDARAYIIPSWHLTHPGQAQLERLVGAWPHERHHDVFLTEMLPANRDFNSRWLKDARSLQGHVVVRVASDGRSYRIFVLDSTQEQCPVSFVSDVYTCRT